MSEYTAKAESFLADHKLTYTWVLVGDDCPKFCEDARYMRDMDKVNTYPRKSHIHGKHYRCTFVRYDGPIVKGRLDVEFWNSYHDEEFNYLLRESKGLYLESLSGRLPLTTANMLARHGLNKPNVKERKRIPTAYDVLACIQKYDPGTFEEFCSWGAYDLDSIQAEQTHKAVVEEWTRVSRFFTAEELDQLQEIN